MAILQKDSDEVWLVIDARTANGGISSGISRFVSGLTCALCSELSLKRKNPTSLYRKLKILIISKTDPSDWIIDLIYKYPDTASFWRGDTKGILKTKIDKPSWLWPTLMVKKLQNMTGNKIIWFAPANFDRPLFISNKNMATRVIQVVHDNIPFLKMKGFGFLFKRQFRFLVSRSLTKLPYIATVSHHSAGLLGLLVKKRQGALHIISDAVDEIFGNKMKKLDREQIMQERNLFIKGITNDFDNESIFSCYWVIGVGRNQKYKSWDIGLQAIEKLNGSDSKKKIWFIRIGADNKEISGYNKKCAVKEYGKIKVFEDLSLIVFPTISDKQLSNLYYISDLLVHPSLAEGFGLPPIEAALCGLPVIYRKGTAVDEHFIEGSLPNNFWNSIDSQYSAVWANQIERILFDKKDSSFYKGLFSSPSPRQYILNFCKTDKSFKWEDSANSLLELLSQPGGIIDNILEKNLHI